MIVTPWREEDNIPMRGTGTSPRRTRVLIVPILLSWKALNGMSWESATCKHNSEISLSSWPAAFGYVDKVFLAPARPCGGYREACRCFSWIWTPVEERCQDTRDVVVVVEVTLAQSPAQTQRSWCRKCCEVYLGCSGTEISRQKGCFCRRSMSYLRWNAGTSKSTQN